MNVFYSILKDNTMRRTDKDWATNIMLFWLNSGIFISAIWIFVMDNTFFNDLVSLSKTDHG